MNARVTSEVETITPYLAAFYLANNDKKNRPLNQKHVDSLAREMTSGRWKLNGDAIRFSGDDVVDGQHRLAAVAKSGVTILSLVVRGLDASVFDTIDQGKRRSASDTLSVLGETNTARLGAALCVIDRYKQGVGWNARRYTNTEVVGLLSKYPNARRSVNMASHHGLVMPFSILAACHFLFAEKDQIAADQFVSDIHHGAGLGPDDPVHVFRERMIANSIAKAKLRPAYTFALCIKAWNLRRAGKMTRTLRIREEGGCPEAFPTVSD